MMPFGSDKGIAGAPVAIVKRHLETLAILGEVREVEGGRFAGALNAVLEAQI